jgi:phosphoserine phosphatase
VLVASDSRNDIPLLQYSSGVRIVVNSRNRDPEEFFRTGNIARDDSWLVIDRPTADNGEPAPWQTFR